MTTESKQWWADHAQNFWTAELENIGNPQAVIFAGRIVGLEIQRQNVFDTIYDYVPGDEEAMQLASDQLEKIGNRLTHIYHEMLEVQQSEQGLPQSRLIFDDTTEATNILRGLHRQEPIGEVIKIARANLGKEPIRKDYDIPVVSETNFDDNGWRIVYNGITQNPPEMDGGNAHWEGPAVYYNLGRLEIQNLPNSQKLDLIRVTPAGWTWKQIKSDNPGYCPPEKLHELKKLAYADPVSHTLVIGDLDGSELNGETTAQVLLWLLLVAKYSEEHGCPNDPVSGQQMIEAISQRRQEIIAAMSANPLSRIVNQNMA